MPSFSPFDRTTVTVLLALCGEPDAWLALLAGLTSQAGVVVSLFVVGLISGVTHCSGMCGPFVLMRVMQNSATCGSAAPSTLQRLGQAALWRYHLGRATTYSALGAAAASAAGVALDWVGFRWVVVAILSAAAIYAGLTALHAAGLINGSTTALFHRIVPSRAARLVGWASRIGEYHLGVALGFLPCGIVYGALAAAASTGDAATGALAMAGFALGTAPGLVAVGFGGAFFVRRFRRFRLAMLPLLSLNIAILTAFVLQVMV
jgi:uncharacterized protein